MQSFSVNEFTFRQVLSVPETRIWRCDAADIEVVEHRLVPTPLYRSTVQRGEDVLSRRGEPRIFADPKVAAALALAEWM